MMSTSQGVFCMRVFIAENVKVRGDFESSFRILAPKFNSDEAAFQLLTTENRYSFRLRLRTNNVHGITSNNAIDGSGTSVTTLTASTRSSKRRLMLAA